jgi:hypothetical protein
MGGNMFLEVIRKIEHDIKLNILLKSIVRQIKFKFNGRNFINAIKSIPEIYIAEKFIDLIALTDNVDTFNKKFRELLDETKELRLLTGRDSYIKFRQHFSD